MRVLGFVLALICCSVPAFAQAPTALRETYQRNLTACVTRTASCDRAALSQADRNYLRYEMGEQRFGVRDAEDVVSVRMEGYEHAPATIVGKVTPDTAATPAVSTQATPARNCMIPVKAYTKRNGTVVEAHTRRRAGC
jgi:hypothetical protein